MNKLKKIIFTIPIILFVMLLQSCSTQPIYYHSEARLPYFNKTTKTVFELIKDDYSTNLFGFGVISAKDDDTLSYVLLAPSKTSQFVQELTDVNLSYSIPLLPNQVKDFMQVLKNSEQKWNTKFDVKHGLSYEFKVSPENKIIQVSENVVTWFPIFKFYFQNTEDGPLGSIFFGEGLLQFHYKIEKLSEIRDLYSMLKFALIDK